MKTSSSLPCLDCGKPLPHVLDEAYPRDVGRSCCYLCPFCRTHRYRSEQAAMARCYAGLERRAPLALIEGGKRDVEGL